MGSTVHRYGARMRQLLPVAAEVDPVETYLAAERMPPADRPWVLVGMVSSLDGATAVEGRSGALGGPGDREVFRAVRAVADVILVAAGTARAEEYGPVRLDERIRAARRAAGRTPGVPRLAIVTASLDVDLDRLSGEGPPPLVFTTESSDEARRADAATRAEVRVLGRDAVDVSAALRSLRADGVGVVVSEGGPTLNAALVEADLVDEWCVTLAPTVAGGGSPRVVSGAPAVVPPRDLELRSLLTQDGALFGRWTRRGA